MTWHIGEVEEDQRLVALLRGDGAWAAYGLCDLDEPYREHSRYIGAWRDGCLEAAILVFAPPGFTSLIPFGRTAGVECITSRSDLLPTRGVFQGRPEDIRALQLRYAISSVDQMVRMVVRSAEAQRIESSYAEILPVGTSGAQAVNEIYGHWPEVAFDPLMLEHGVYGGAFRQGELIAIAGTHALTVQHSVATVGGVLTHPEHRGHGLAAATTSWVVAGLSAMGIEDVALNVKADNIHACRAYERVGFQRVMPFLEGRFAAVQDVASD